MRTQGGQVQHARQPTRPFNADISGRVTENLRQERTSSPQLTMHPVKYDPCAAIKRVWVACRTATKMGGLLSTGGRKRTPAGIA